MMKKRWTVIASAVVITLIFFYLFHEVFINNVSRYETQTALESTVQDTVDVKAFIVRDEEYISGNQQETVVPLVPDGQRVASGDAVARVCKSEKDAANYSELLADRAMLERYTDLSTQTELNALDIEKLNREIDERFTEILRLAGHSDYTGLNGRVADLEDKLASKQVVSTGSIDLSGRMAALKSRISELETMNIGTRDVEAPGSGYYISNTDGYENTLKYDDIENITVSKVLDALDAKPSQAPDNLGKIVGSYKWYIAAVVDSKYSSQFENGKSFKINIPRYGLENVPVQVHYSCKAEDGKMAVVFSCNLMDEVYANMRVENIEIVMKEYTGYKISSAALRSEKNSKNEDISVVYVIRSSIMNVRKVEIVADKGDYVIVSENTQKDGSFKPVSLYDEVIVKGRDLEDGKSVY